MTLNKSIDFLKEIDRIWNTPVLDEIVEWAKEGVSQLGCSPCTLAVGIGRSHYEAASLML